MEEFAKTFVAIDKDESNSISLFELKKYAKDHNFGNDMVEKWKKMFDPNNTGEITLDKFCDVIGVKPADIETARKNASKLDQNVNVLAARFPHARQAEITKFCNDLTAKMKPFDGGKMAKELKLYLDTTFGRAWQVVVSMGPFWIRDYHVPERSFHYQINGISYSVWKTPAQF